MIERSPIASRNARGGGAGTLRVSSVLYALALALIATTAEAKPKPPVNDDHEGFWYCKAENDEDIAAQGCDGSGTVCWCCYEDGCYFCDLTVGTGGCWSFYRPPRPGADIVRPPPGGMTISPGTPEKKKPPLTTPLPNLNIAPQ